MAKGEILYIEDNFLNRRIVRKILERQDYVLHEAEDGLDGYEQLKKLKPKVVLLDITLPGMDGLEIARSVKADPGTRDVILVALTASAMVGDRERFLGAGCDDYLSKPFRANDLVAIVDFYMSPDFVPGSMLTPGAELRLSKKQASLPASNGNGHHKVDLAQDAAPNSNGHARPAAEHEAGGKQKESSKLSPAHKNNQENVFDHRFNEFIHAVEPANPNLSSDG